MPTHSSPDREFGHENQIVQMGTLPTRRNRPDFENHVHPDKDPLAGDKHNLHAPDRPWRRDRSGACASGKPPVEGKLAALKINRRQIAPQVYPS
jgi:hypothetical protein